MKLYILEGKTPIVCNDIIGWTKWRANNKIVIKKTVLPGSVTVSTTFIGIDQHNLGDPLVFETMIFGGEHDRYQKKYATWEEAEQGHEDAIVMIFD